MGHDAIAYGDEVVVMHEQRILLLRHFALEQAQALTPDTAGVDQATLDQMRSFFEAWYWMCPGCVAGTRLDDFVCGRKDRRDLLVLLFEQTIGRLKEFGEVIPLSYLHERVEDGRNTWGIEQPTRFLIEPLMRLCELLRRFPSE